MGKASVITRAEYLRRLLVPFWLRPESALWYAHEAFLARDYLGEPLEGPSLEVGCMDGVSTFIMLGGEFSPSFDVYSEVQWSEQSHQWLSLADDYYNIVDESRRGESIAIARPPADRVDVGLSWKESHVTKASRLGIYGRVVQHDVNRGLEILATESFATIWAPNLYWIDELAGPLAELRRVLRGDGRLVTVLPDKCALDYMLYQYRTVADPNWIANLDRGRHENISRQARSEAEWLSFFADVRLSVARHDRFLHKLVLQVNDIGLRPLFPALMNMYEVLRAHSPEDLLRVKEHWMRLAFDFLRPLCDIDWMDRVNMSKVWHIFELRRA